MLGIRNKYAPDISGDTGTPEILRHLVVHTNILFNIEAYIDPSLLVTLESTRDDDMRLNDNTAVSVYTISGSNTARPLPEWLVRKRRRSLKNDPEFANRIELLQDFEFEEASQCIRVSEDGQYVMSTGKRK